MEPFKSYLLVSLIAAVLTAVLILVAGWKIRWRRRRRQFEKIGSEAEQELARRLSRRWETNRVLTNLYLPNKKGATTEIDVLYLCRRGIFILECKHYSGEVFGDEDAAKWYHGLSGGRGFEFYNPIAQNRAHYNALRRVLNPCGERVLYPIVVFCGPCILKKVKVRTDFCRVVKENRLFRTMRRMSAHGPRLSRKEILRTAKQLEPYCHVTRRQKREHLNYVKSKK